MRQIVVVFRDQTYISICAVLPWVLRSLRYRGILAVPLPCISLNQYWCLTVSGRFCVRRVAAAPVELQRLAARLHSSVDVWGGTILLERSNGAALFRRKSYVVGLLSTFSSSTMSASLFISSSDRFSLSRRCYITQTTMQTTPVKQLTLAVQSWTSSVYYQNTRSMP